MTVEPEDSLAREYPALAELRGPVGELLGQWERRIRARATRRSRDPAAASFDDAEEFADRWETAIQGLGVDLGEARRSGIGTLRDELEQSLSRPLEHAHAYLALASRMNLKASTEWRRSRKRGDTLDVLVELHAQGLLVADEVLCLLAGGYPSGAEARWRTLYELSVVARFIAGQADKVARRYKASHVVERWRGIRAGDLDYLMTEAPGEYSAYVQMVEREYNEIIRKYGASMDGSYGWATEALGQENATFHALATFVLGESKGDRWLRYTNASQHIHGVRLASVNAFQVSRDRRGPRYTPKPVGTYLPFMDMIDSIHSITHALGRTAYEVHEVPEIPYFDSVCGMVALDVRTEALRSWQEVDPGFLHRALGIAQHG